MHQFHTFSTAVWALWMITLVSGFALALPRMATKTRPQPNVLTLPN